MSTSALYRAAAVGRLMARMAGTVVALIFIASMSGGEGPLRFGLYLRHDLFLVSLAMLLGGLLLVWKSQLWGGTISLAGFALMVAMEGGRPPGMGGLFLWPVAMALVNLVCWWTLPEETPEDGAAWVEAWWARLKTPIYRAALVGRWVARVAGTLVALLFLAFVAGEGPPSLFRLSFKEDLIFLAMGGLFLGLLLAWKWQFWGGAIPLAAFAYLALAGNMDMSRSLLLFAPAGIGALNLVCWWRIRAGRRVGLTAWHVPKTPLIVVGAAVGVFVALCANEMFGNPPLMTPAFRPTAAMVGEWRATPAWLPGQAAADEPETVFVINPDGSVTGRVGDAAVMGGRMGYARSWFGKLMKWRTDYAIHGRLDHAAVASGLTEYSGEFAAPLTLYDGELTGWLTFRYGRFSVMLKKE
jgi:hypothetical protein